MNEYINAIQKKVTKETVNTQYFVSGTVMFFIICKGILKSCMLMMTYTRMGIIRHLFFFYLINAKECFYIKLFC